MDKAEIEAIKQIKNGNIDQFTILVKKYTAIVFKFVRKKTPTKEDAEDITQISFIRFYESIPRFDIKKKVLPYLLQIAKNEIKMFYRKHKNTLPLKEDIYLTDNSFEDNININNTQDLLSFLKKQEREILGMISDGYSYKEVSIKFNKSLNTLKSIIRRARLRLKFAKKNKEEV